MRLAKQAVCQAQYGWHQSHISVSFWRKAVNVVLCTELVLLQREASSSSLSSSHAISPSMCAFAQRATPIVLTLTSYPPSSTDTSRPSHRSSAARTICLAAHRKSSSHSCSCPPSGSLHTPSKPVLIKMRSGPKALRRGSTRCAKAARKRSLPEACRCSRDGGAL